MLYLRSTFPGSVQYVNALASFYNKLVKAKGTTIVVQRPDLQFRRAVERFEGVHFRHTVSGAYVS